MNTNETIYLKNSIIIRKIVKKTKSEFFKTVMVGDILDLSTPVLHMGRGFRGNVYATNILVINRKVELKFLKHYQNYLLY